MDTQRDLELVLRSPTPLVVIETRDESGMLALLKTIGMSRAKSDYVPLFRWTVTDGLQRLDIDLEPQLHNADAAGVLKHIRAVTSPGIYVLLDFHPYLDDPLNIRLVKDICLGFHATARYLILLSHKLTVPAELRSYSARFDMALPTEAQRTAIVKRVAAEWAADNPGSRVKADPEAYRLLIQNLAGLTDADTERLARNAVYQDGPLPAAIFPP